jgi:hypothetical protein
MMVAFASSGLTQNVTQLATTLSIRIQPHLVLLEMDHPMASTLYEDE